MATNDLVKKLEKNTTQLARLNSEIEKAVGAQIAKRNELEQQNADMRQAILEAMEAAGTENFDGDLIKISYRKPTTRTTFDSKKFAAERPKTYEKYLKTSPVKSSITIKLKA